MIRSTLVLMLLIASTACANVGPPSSGGRIVAEPVGIQDIVITHETLEIDLRPVAGNDMAKVEAVYQLNNTGKEVRLQLLFASGTFGDTQFEITLDGIVLASQPSDAPLPESWKAPKTTPNPSSNQLLYYLEYTADKVKPIAFEAVFPPGSHVLRVRYRAPTSRHFYGEPTMFHQFAYILAPAKSWAGFGGLDVTIHLPEHWTIKTTPSFTRDGDTLRGSFKTISHDAIAITIQAPIGNYQLHQRLTILGLGLVGLGGAIVCCVLGVRVGKNAKSIGSLWFVGGINGVAYMIAIALAGVAAIYLPTAMLPADQVTVYGYGQLFAIIGLIVLGVLALPIGLAITMISGAIARKAKLAS